MVAIVIEALREGFEGPDVKKSHYLDSTAAAGLRNTLASLTPEEASRKWGNNSIAAQAAHILFSFEAFGSSIAGDRSPRDWDSSWLVDEVDATDWKKLRDELEAAYEDLCAKIETHAARSEDARRRALTAALHLAYHLGAIRQKVSELRAG